VHADRCAPDMRALGCIGLADRLKLCNCRVPVHADELCSVHAGLRLYKASYTSSVHADVHAD
jgi:hypothetical protein